MGVERRFERRIKSPQLFQMRKVGSPVAEARFDVDTFFKALMR